MSIGLHPVVLRARRQQQQEQQRAREAELPDATATDSDNKPLLTLHLPPRLRTLRTQVAPTTSWVVQLLFALVFLVSVYCALMLFIRALPPPKKATQ